MRIRLSEAQAEALLADFQSFRIELVQADMLISTAFRLARYYTCSHWDGLYLAAAQVTNSRLIHADQNLRMPCGVDFLWNCGSRTIERPSNRLCSKESSRAARYRLRSSRCGL